MSKKEWGAYFNAIKKHDWDMALKSLNIILVTEQKNPQVHLKIGDVLQKAGDNTGAVLAYHRSALLFMKQGFLQKALAIFKIILRLDPHNLEALNRSKELMQELESSKIHVPTIPAKQEREVGVELSARTEDVEQRSETVHTPSLFASLPEDERKQFLDSIEPQLFSSGQLIVKEGDYGDSIFIIKSGHAKVVTRILGREIELATLSAGDTFGEVAFLTGRPRTASVIARDTVEVTEFNISILEEILGRYPEVLKKLHDFYQCHLQDTLAKVRSEMK